jgi:hypothetical protein
MTPCDYDHPVTPPAAPRGTATPFVVTYDDARVLREGRAYHVTWPRKDTSDRLVSLDQWLVMKSDLDAIPPGLWVWAEILWAAPMALYSDRPLTDLAPYAALRGTPYLDTAKGLGWPLPCCRANGSYPLFPGGVGHAGTSVPVHEWGHVVGRWLTPSRGRNDLEPGLFWQPAWQAAWKKAAWPWSPLLRDNPEEAGAESFAAYLLRRQGDPNGHAPQLDPVIVDFWDGTLRSVGWVR